MNAPMLHAPVVAPFADLFVAACELDVVAFKPGNVSHESPGHGMTAEHFLISAKAAAPYVADSRLCVGERIYRAIEATRQAVDCNTNLGIVLLAVPLIHAVENRSFSTTRSLAWHVHHTLRMLTREDTQWVYQAIRLAAPGGLGKSQRHDVKDEPTVTLRGAMQEAAERDRIAYQYAHAYADVFGRGLISLKQGREHWGSEDAAITTTYLGFLTDFPDSHIWRKYGLHAAADVQKMARDCVENMRQCADWACAKTCLEAFDRLLKTADFNPGTSADLTVATWLADRLSHGKWDQHIQPEEEKRSVGLSV